MDQKRLFLAIAISLAILLGFQFLIPHPTPHPPPVTTHQATTTPVKPVAPTAVPDAAAAVAREAPRVKIDAPRVTGSISLVGARLDSLELDDYRETLAKNSPLVRLLAPRQDPQPTYVQFGWTGEGGLKVPDQNTLWTASATTLTRAQPVTLRWDNGAGVIFEITYSIDDNYMVHAEQLVHNQSAAPITVHPWSRVRRDYTPETGGYSVLHEGLIGWVGGRLHDVTYSSAKSEGGKHEGIAFQGSGTGGWAGFTDKYWLIAVVPDQTIATTTTFRYLEEPGGAAYQVDTVTDKAEAVPPQGEAKAASRAFVGAKEVHLLNQYEEKDGISHFSYAIDWGWFWFLTKPIYYALDWLNAVLGNFGLAIMAFTIAVKALFFPLANYSYRSMSKMKLLAPKMQALREQYKDDQGKLQQQIMGLYKAEGVNPASGCLPMIVQIPVFFSLYKVIFINIEMRHAPFFGWIRDLSAIDPTNVFNLFGLIPFDPTTISPFLHLGLWPLIMGVTMWGQQKLNPPPPDPMQAKLFQFMPVIFTFMLARFPAGLVIYWTWNNLLTIGQQWLIMRQTRLARPNLART
ncbi:MAG: membrane protein insertase YidC [Alphaproteobacteria bacterium]|nr:membrane protein insertase YidC [Alphaproteobacteria bacterium]